MLPFFQYGHRKNYNKNSIPYLIAPSVAMYIINRPIINYQVNHKYTLFCLYHVFRPCYLSGSNSSEIHILYILNCCKNVILWVKAVTLKGMTLSKEANLPEWILISIIYNKQKAPKNVQLEILFQFLLLTHKYGSWHYPIYCYQLQWHLM